MKKERMLHIRLLSARDIWGDAVVRYYGNRTDGNRSRLDESRRLLDEAEAGYYGLTCGDRDANGNCL